MDRRAALKFGVAAGGFALTCGCSLGAQKAAAPAGQIMTVNGLLPTAEMGLTLAHEHLFSGRSPTGETGERNSRRVFWLSSKTAIDDIRMDHLLMHHTLFVNN